MATLDVTNNMDRGVFRLMKRNTEDHVVILKTAEKAGRTKIVKHQDNKDRKNQVEDRPATNRGHSPEITPVSTAPMQEPTSWFPADFALYEYKTRHDKTRRDKTRQDKTKEDTTRHEKRREDKTR